MIPFLLFALVVVASSGAGLALTLRLKWADGASEAGVPAAAAFALAPLLTGLTTVIVLSVAPGASHELHLTLVLGVLGGGAVAALRSRSPVFPRFGLFVASAPQLAVWLVLGYVLALLFDALSMPLIQNDALEYATVARMVYEARDLSVYPALHPEATVSGFFGPWTHPPMYVALLYLTSVIGEGEPGATLMLRFVAPWCLVAATGCVAALGRWSAPGAGAIAAALFVSTPLLFLGAASALIDPLPVLGFTLTWVAMVTVAGVWSRIAALGIALGLALWTHSQAILFPMLVLPLLPLLPAFGSRLRRHARFKAALQRGLAAAALALVIGSLPYVRNVVLFGSPVSDNPKVFAFAALDWPQYFRVQRGLDSAAELVQYGVFKGFFAPEAYGFAFWLGLVGVPAALAACRRSLFTAPAVAEPRDGVLIVALGVWVLYLAATALSVGLGIDLMVRNERYMLVLLPGAALLAAVGLAYASSRSGRALRCLALTVIGIQLVVLITYRFSQLEDGWARSEPTLARWPPFAAVDFLRRHTPADTRILTLKPADMYYADRTMVSYLDPRMLPFYSERDPARAVQELRKLGVTRIHMPDYWLPPVYNSTLMAVLASNRWTSLDLDSGGYQVFRLLDAESSRGEDCGARTNVVHWRRSAQVVLGGRKSLFRVSLGSEEFEIGAKSSGWNHSSLFLRETTTVLSASVPFSPKTGARGEVRLELELEGDGFALISADMRDEQGRLLNHRLLADLPLSEESGVKRVARRFLLAPGTSRIDLAVEHRSRSWLRIRSAGVSQTGACE